MRQLLFVTSACLILLGCGEGDFTQQERAKLEGFALGPMPPSPSNAKADDPLAAALGKNLFFETRFSGALLIGDDGSNGGLGIAGEYGRVACVSCHDPSNGGSDQRSPGGTSLAAGYTGRNAPTCFNTAWSPWMFWDGRKDSVWSQALGPIESPVEHNGTRLQVAHLLYDLYRTEYEAIFGTMPDLADAVRFPPEGKPGMPSWEGMTPADQEAVNRVFANFGKAIEAYERKLVSRDSPFDRYMSGDREALSPAAIRGAKLFVGRASCDECHRGGTLSDGRFHNLGVPQLGPAVPSSDSGRASGIPQVLGDPFNRAGDFSDAPDETHLAALAPEPRDVGSFKTPTLRSVSRTAPYMHTGAFGTLREVVLFYRAGGGVEAFEGVKDPAIRPLNLSDGDVDDLVEFLKAFDGAPLPADVVDPPVLP